MTINPELKRPFQKSRFEFSPARVRVNKKHTSVGHSKDDFSLGERLGKGSFGEVFLAKHNHTGFLFALKVIPKKVVVEKKMQRQLLW